MDFIKSMMSDSDKEAEAAGQAAQDGEQAAPDLAPRKRVSSKKERDKMNKTFDEAQKYDKNRALAKADDIAPVEIPMEDMDLHEELMVEKPLTQKPPARAKSRAVVLPSGMVIGSDSDDDSIHTSTLSSHSSDDFGLEPGKDRKSSPGFIGSIFTNKNKVGNVEDVDTGLTTDDRKTSTVKKPSKVVRRRRSVGGGTESLGRKAGGVSVPTNTQLSLAERRTLRNAERVGMVQKKQLPFCTRIGYEFTTGIQKTTRKIQEAFRNLTVWGRSIKQVEGDLGSGVATYFRVLRWLLRINTICMVLSLGLIVTPGIYITETQNDTTPAIYNKEDLKCLNPDFLNGTDLYHNVTNSVLQFFTGEGWLEATAMFIGWYPTNNLTKHDDEKTVYNFPLAYLSVGLCYFILALCFIASNIARLFKKSAAESIETKNYSALVLTGWDFTINNEETARLKSATIIKSLKEELHNDASKDLKRSLQLEIGIAILRLFTNAVCIAAMIGTIFIYMSSIFKDSNEENAGKTDSCGETIVTYTVNVSNVNVSGLSDAANLLAEEFTSFWSSYSASIIVSLSNIIFPIFFEMVGKVEMYKFQSTRIGVTMFRSFVMKVFSMCSFLYILYKATKPSGGMAEHWQNETNTLFFNCWENYIGAQLYQLCIIDFIVFCSALFIGEVLRSFVIRNVSCIRSRVQLPEFNIPKEILDLTYKQMIFWSALFFSPLMACVAVIEVIAIFYFKKFSALRNVRPPQKVVLTANTSSMVNFVFLASLLAIFIFVGLVVFRFHPSTKCGPFRDKSEFLEPLNDVIAHSGIFKQYIIDNIKTTSIAISIAIVVALIVYYYRSLAASREITIKLLRHQIKVEHVDKQFLIAQIKAVITGKEVKPKSNQFAREMSESTMGDGKKKKKKIRTIHRFANPSMVVTR